MEPTTDELINGCGGINSLGSPICAKGELCDDCNNRLQGRLDVYEEWYNGSIHCEIDCNCPFETLEQEIAKIKAVLS